MYPRSLRTLAALCLWLAAGPAFAATISASPKAAAPGAEFIASASGLTSGDAYRIELYRGGIGGVTYSLSSFTASGTEAARRVKVPAAAAATGYELRLIDASRFSTVLGTFPFTVRPGLGVTLEPASAEPGRAVRVTLAGLRAGSISLSYAGGSVLGPVAVGEGTWSGKFVVPRDRPASIPSTTSVVATNTVGRLVASTGSASFGVLAPSGLPRFRASTTLAPPATVTESRKFTFSGKLTRPDDKGTTGRTSFFWRPAGGGRVIPIDGGVRTAPDGSYTLDAARAPSFWLDGASGFGAGDVVAVVSDDDPDTEAPRDSSVATGQAFAAEAEEGRLTQFAFAVRLVGRRRDGTTVPISGAYIDVQGNLDGAFIDPTSAPPPSDGDMMATTHQFSRGIEDALIDLGAQPYTNGCPVNFARKFTGPDGEASFLVDVGALLRGQLLTVMKNMGEVRTQAAGVPSPLEDIWNPGEFAQEDVLFKRRKGNFEDFIEPLSFVLRIQAGQQGYGQHGVGSNEQLEDVVTYRPTYITVVFDQVGGAMDAFGSPLVINGQTVVVPLDELPDGSSGVAPYDLRIAGVRGQEPQAGSSTVEFKGMHSFPPGTSWPPIIVRNQGRQMRFAWEAGFGQVESAVLGIQQPDNTFATSSFSLEGPSECNLSGAHDWVAALPDMTAWPFSSTQEPYCRTGTVRVRLLGGAPDATRKFRLCTERPPAQLTSGQVKNVTIDALANIYEGELDIPNPEANESSSQMTQWDIPPLANRARNQGMFRIYKAPSGNTGSDLGAASAHTLGNEETDDTGHGKGEFGFDDDGDPLREVVLDTGTIPLFRYPWGFSPIAGAVFGADFWLSSTLAFYGNLGAGGSHLMNATIDPTLNGGLDIFFDLDVLFGLVSASVSAQPQLGLSMKQKIGNGGLPGDQNGLCFGFDVDVAMEICAVLCAEDEFNLFRAREPNGCSVAMRKALPTGELDLAAPKLAPSSLAVDGYAHTVVLEPDAEGHLLAYHMEGTELVATRTVASNAWAIQHVEVEYLGDDKALAVWSQSSLSRSQLGQLMQAAGAVRSNADDVARAQVLRWSWFDGSSWSAPAAVAGARSGSGKPKLAVRRCSAFDCLRAAAVPTAYLVWEYDANQDISAPDLEVWGAYFEYPAGFAGAARVSGSAGTSDMSADVAWLGSTPLVAWISAPLPHYQPSTLRRVQYRVLDDPQGGRSTSAVRNADVPLRAGWPSLARVDADTAVLAFTVAQDSSVVGNRNALYAARVDCSGDTCTFQETEVRDTNGRQYRVERPVAAIDGDGVAVVSFRGLAYGPDARGGAGRPGDAIGMLTGTGEHLAVRLPSFAAATTQVAPQGLSNDGLLHWRPDLVFDPALDGFVAISRRANEALGKNAVFDAARKIAGRGSAAAGAKALGADGLVLTTLAPAPDFRIESFNVAATYLQAGQTPSFAVRIRNAGADYDPAMHGSATLHAAWDAPPGAGTDAGFAPVALAPLASGALVTLIRTATVPAGHQSDERRTLFVEVKAAAATAEAVGDDNLASHTLGAMPVPQNINAMTMLNSPLVTLAWEAPADPRVVGYRVYKRAESGAFVPYGSTDVPGYADGFAGFRDTERYRVTSYSARGIESEPSTVAIARPLQEAALFRDGFQPDEF